MANKKTPPKKKTEADSENDQFQVKHKTTGVEYTVSKKYFDANKATLELVDA